MADAIRFLLNGDERSIAGAAPAATLLDWLRTEERQCATKEGCAEGDCGACTVVLGEAGDGRMRYRAVNSCLVALGQLDGRLVVTAEGLAAPDGTLHPVQTALIESDASQCGFCTPGFAMSLFAYAHGGEPGEDDIIHDMLAGNLCRCTGYRPIVDAARRCAGGADDHFGAREGELTAAVAALQRPGAAEFDGAGQRFFAPDSLNGLAELRAAHPDARLLAGGTDLGLLAAKERRPPDTVISVMGVPELRRVVQTDSGLVIGAAITYGEILPTLAQHYPSMAALVRRIGSRQIRNLGTIAGNLANASPIADMPPCLIALDATVVVRSRAGQRDVRVEDFFTAYRKTALGAGEFIEAVRIPYLQAGEIFHAYKVSKRFDQDISAVIGAYRLSVENGLVRDIRIAYGGMAETTKRAAACERALIGQPWSEATVAAGASALAGDFTPISDFRATAGYRTRVAANLLRRLHLQTAMPDLISEVSAL